MNEEQLRAEIRDLIGKAKFSELIKELRLFFTADEGVTITLPSGDLTADAVDLVQKMVQLGMRDAFISMFDIIEMNKDADENGEAP